jgi:hypothetical protein
MAKKIETCRRISTCLYVIVTNIAVIGIYMVAQYLLWKSREHLVVSDFWWVNLVYHVMWQLSGVDLHHHSSCSSLVGRRRTGAHFVWQDLYNIHSFGCWHMLWMCSDYCFSLATYIYNLCITYVNDYQFYYMPRAAVYNLNLYAVWKPKNKNWTIYQSRN